MKTLRRLATYLNPYTSRMTIALVCMAVVSGLTALTMYLIKPALDRIFIAHDMGMLKTILWLVPSLFALKGGLSFAQSTLMAYIGNRVIRDLRDELFEHVQTLSMEFFSKQSTGKLMARFTNDLGVLQSAISRAPIYLVRDGLTALILLGVLFSLSWKFTLVTLGIIPPAALLILVLGRALRRYGRKGQEQMAELFTCLQENIEGASVVRAYSAEGHETARFRKANHRTFELAMRFTRTDNISSPSMEFIGALVITFILWYGGRDVIEGAWTAGSFFAFLGSALSTYKPLKNFADLNAQLQLGIAAADRVFELRDQRPTVVEAPFAAVLPPLTEVIHYDHVSFTYPALSAPPGNGGMDHAPPRAALRDIHLKIGKGEIVALVGPSGAGKTTLALLLPRFYDPTEGRVRIDGRDIREITLGSLRAQIGLVTQEIILFNTTVAENILYGKPGASEAEIRKAAEAANAHLFLQRLPHGYQTLIGEKGVRLSGGERQRLAIARALLKNPPLLILDEATSALDAESERLVQEAVERLMENRTVLVIAHRLATVRRADRIIVLERGQVVEEGNHETLLSQRGPYHRLHSLQLVE